MPIQPSRPPVPSHQMPPPRAPAVRSAPLARRPAGVGGAGAPGGG